jgi:hypothetical protein
VPALSRFEEPLDLNLVFSGHGKHLDCPTLRLTNHHGLMIAGEAALSNWDAGMDMYIYGKLGNLIHDERGHKRSDDEPDGKGSSHFATFGLYSL